MTDIVKFSVLKSRYQRKKGRKAMTNFDEYIQEMEVKRAKRKNAAYNLELKKRLQEKTKEDAVAELYAALVFPCGSAEILLPRQRAFA